MAAAESVRARRKALDLSQNELAGRAGISRQALSAIEAGLYQPAVGVALSLARELGRSVEALFGSDGETNAQSVDAHWYGPPHTVGCRATLGRVGGKVVAVPQPATGLALNPAAGVIARLHGNRADVATYNSSDEIDAAVLVAGCDPSVSLLADWMTRHHALSRIVPVFCSSTRALDAVVSGCVHIAGVHLRGAGPEEYNVQRVRRALRRRPGLMITFARWEVGLAVGKGNPFRISGIADLQQPRMRIANRERGSGARAVLDAGLKQAGIRPATVAGYDSEYGGHLEVANAIISGRADAGIMVRIAADVYGLEFIPLHEERYDLVILESEADKPAVRAILDTFNSRRFAREISQFCGYDTESMGQVVARLMAA